MSTGTFRPTNNPSSPPADSLSAILRDTLKDSFNPAVLADFLSTVKQLKANGLKPGHAADLLALVTGVRRKTAKKFIKAIQALAKDLERGRR